MVCRQIKRGGASAPFHADKKPSLKIYPNGKGYYCFSCGAGGDPIKFAAQYRDVNNYEAAKGLAAAFQVPNTGAGDYREKREAELPGKGGRNYQRSSRGQRCG